MSPVRLDVILDETARMRPNKPFSHAKVLADLPPWLAIMPANVVIERMATAIKKHEVRR